MRFIIGVILLCWLLSPPDTARAIILLGTGDPEANTTAPGGVLAGSGWDTQTARPASATAVGPRHFVSASHLGGSVDVGSATPFAGLRYPIVRSLLVPGTGDLRFFEVAGRLPAHGIAEMYSGTEEVGRPAIIHGMGLGRGTPVIYESAGGPELRGWQWGANGGRLRWGTNVVTGTTNSACFGPLLVLHFSNTGGADEAMVTSGDSGGGTFILDSDGRWKLAGVTLDVESTFRLSPTSPDLRAAIFDRRGLFEYTSEKELVQIPEDDPVPGTYILLTRISPSVARIAAEIEKPPDGAWPRLLSAVSVLGEYSEHEPYAVNPASRTISIPLDQDQRFFQLPEGWSVTSLRVDGDLVTLHY
ncbi:MAG: hypothetical protein KIT22_07575 [Verrucomicrobiae bacterium]|nr:hypothetical protein [Verrucomicrobiae bacterium]